MESPEPQDEFDPVPPRIEDGPDGERPRTGESRDPERKAARFLYSLSLWSFPFLLLSLLPDLVFGLRAMPVIGLAILPLVLYGLVRGFRSPSRFVRWHTRQWLLMTAPAMALAFGSGTGAVVGAVLALAVWFAGNRAGRNQVDRGDCWLWRMAEPDVWQPESEALPGDGPSALPSEPSTEPKRPSMAELPGVEVAPSSAPATAAVRPLAAPQGSYDRGVALLAQGKRDEAVSRFLEAFRSGPPALREIAAARLEEMGEVEVF
jgi:hypothetical protein